MNPHLQSILDFIDHNNNLSAEEKNSIIKSLKDADKEFTITEFKLDRTEKVKKTTSVLLEETIEELEKKRKDVEAQNKELEIQNALEKVRAVALGMKEPADMLEICRTISQQLELLHVKEIRNVQTAIFYESKGTYMNYEYYAKHDKTFITETTYTNNKIHHAFANQMLKGSGEFFITHIKGNEVKDWIAYQKTTNVFIDEYLNTASSLNYYWYSLGPVALGISTYEPLKEEETDLFKRFLKVFELSYKRYLDIEQAQAQAREAQIEAALERVRSKTMAMHNSADVGETIAVLFDELKKLGVETIRCGIGIMQNAKNMEVWTAKPNENNKADLIIGHLDINLHPLLQGAFDGWRNKKESFSYELKGDDLINYFTAINNHPAYPVQYNIDTLPPAIYHNDFFFSDGTLFAFSVTQLSDENKKICRRFAGVFGQTYRRYLDLQKAEAQTRESQIQLALERVRARTMAMQKSDELTEAALLLFEQLQSLGTVLWSCGFNIWEKEETGCTSFIARGGKMLPPVKLSFTENPILWLFYESRQKGEEFWFIELSGEDCKSVFGYVAKQRQAQTGDNAFLTEVTMPSSQISHMVNFSHGNLMFITLEPHPELHDIFKRFGKVFEQTYTRFLDLQRAEAQAREAQIEAALERVRSRSLAMHKSDELQEVVHTVVERLKDLNIEFYTAIIILFTEGSKDIIWWLENKEQQQYSRILIPYADNAYWRDMLKAREGGINHFSKTYFFKEKEEFYHQLFEHTDFRHIPDKQKKFLLEAESATMSVALAKNSGIHLTRYSEKAFSEDDNEILRRFANVFEQSYTRFLDLQKAEAQAREAQIETALEKVRSRSMAMQKSEELKDVIRVVLHQFVHLNINVGHAGFYIDYKTHDDMHIWLADPNIEPFLAVIPYFDTPTWNSFLEAKTKGIPLHTDLLDFEEKNKFYNELFKLFPVPEEAKHFYSQCKGLAVSTVLLDNVGLYIENFDAIPYTDEENKILMRFGKVFQQTYTRFLDLQKAEAQAREAQIEAALEKVRSRSLAMHHSEELSEVVNVLFDRMAQLGVVFDAININIVKPEERSFDSWMAAPGQPVPMRLHVSYFDNPVANDLFNAFESGASFFSKIYSREEKNAYFHQLFTFTDFNRLPDERKQMILNAEQWCLAIAIANNTVLSLHSYSGHKFIETDFEILKRFSKVFNQAYTRFLDLQKAEAQAREAQIEAALERVRARTMAMQKSDELADVAELLFKQVNDLGIKTWTTGFNVWSDDNNSYTDYITNPQGGFMPPYTIDAISIPVGIKVSNAKKTGEEFYMNYEEGEALAETYRALSRFGKKQFKSILESGFEFPSHQYEHFVFGTKVSLMFITYDAVPEAHDVFKRFGKVFEQTYTRFLDLQKAEAQAREAQIEAALERVRAKAMAMQNSQHLADTIGVFYHELQCFSITPRRCGVGLLNHQDRFCELFTWNTDEQGQSLELLGKIKMDGHPVLNGVYEHWLNQTEYHPVLRGNEIKEYYKILKPQMAFPDYNHDDVQFGCFFFFPEGGVYAWTDKEMQPDELQIYRRFTSVLGLTYKRYKDLQTSEANAKEAIKQAALDRIRADIASMRTVSDLDRITPLIWNELTILGVPFIRCGVFIMNDEQQRIHTFLSTPDGKAIAAFHIPYNTPGNIKYVISQWRDRENYIDHWDENAFTTFAKTLVEQGALTSPEQYLQTIPHGGFYLHFLPFLQGMLYVGNTTQLSKDEINLIQSLADAFSTAYARYEDFNKLEAAKQQVDAALNELQATQKQLVQSEKMASLGELTAGIAHEIQNPLNFVNNFSEVSKELIDEMRIALKNGDKEEAEQIASDIIQNLEKINHHGRRADAIVKNMLQHSRKSTGQKEPADINALCDEYLRLSFHGMRAKDKSFNADFKTEFDNTIEKINIVPQDIGRVLLNLINNAFYAVNEKKKTADENYKPLVTVRTLKNRPPGGRGAEIVVSDNGSGIPQNIIDKIFQPFFTTKPTGQGTGLGLSLAYDIITKEHNGTIKVESGEGEGTTFIIDLPFV